MPKSNITQEENEQILKEVISIRDRTQLKSCILRDFMKLPDQTYRNNLSPSCKTNHFRKIDLLNLKVGVQKHFQNYNHNL